MNTSRKMAKVSSMRLLCMLSAGLLAIAVGTEQMFAISGRSYAPENVQQTVSRVEGSVKDDAGEPLIGVSVVLKGTTTGTVTDIDGKYVLNIKGDNPILEFSYVGYKAQSIPVTKSIINVVLESDAIQMGDVVVVGYGVQKKEHLTGPISTVDVGKTLDSKPVTDVTKLLQGITPGLTISYNSGNLDSGATIRLRGAGTIIDGKEAGSPLVLVDGVPSDLNMVNPDDIANISVLKDAASGAIYGARGAFGVILVTTKTGVKSDKVKFSYSNNFAFNNPTVKTNFIDPLDELPVLFQGARNAGTNDPEVFGMSFDGLIDGIKNWKEKYAGNRQSNEMVYGEDWEIKGNKAYFYRVWEPNDIMLRSWSPTQTHSLSAQGSLGSKSTFMMSLGFTSQDGLLKVKEDNLKRYNANLSLTTQLASWLKSTVGATFVRRDYKDPFNYYDSSGINRGDGSNGYFGYYMRWGKYFPYGTYQGKYFRHAPGYMDAANYNTKQTDYLRLSLALTADITKEIQLTAEYNFANTGTDRQINGYPLKLLNFWGDFDANDIIGSGYNYVASVGSSSDKIAVSKAGRDNHIFNAYATYTKELAAGHNFKATLGTNIEKEYFKRTYSERRNVMDPSMNNIGLATGDAYASSTYWILKPREYDSALAGFFARVNYDYMGKYLFEAIGRYDGSSKFPTNKLWGFFPSVSAGYRITEEPFMQGVKSVANDIKIRASYGQIGNQEVADNAFRAMMDITTLNWITNGSVTASVEAPKLYDDGLSWERIESVNFGIDAQFLDNMFGLTVDLYQRYNKDMLALGATLPQSTGTVAPLTNAGDMRTRGFEIGVNFNKPINKNIAIYASATLSDYKSVITRWKGNDGKKLGEFYEGMTLGEIWGFETDRLFQVSDFSKDANGAYVLNSDIPSQKDLYKGNFSVMPGDVKYKNLDGDDKIGYGNRTVENHGDLKVIGNTTPRYEYSFRLGGEFYGFDVDLFFQGVGKRDYWASSDLVLPLYNRSDALYGDQMDYWTEENTGAFYPRPYTGHATNAVGSGVSGSNNFVTQTRYLLDMSYLRLKNVTVGYTLPRALTTKIGIDKARIYFSGQNLAEFKNSKLPVDPEINETEAQWGRTYPYSRTLSFGLQVNF